MQGTQKIVFGVLAVILALAFTACPGPTQPTPELEPPAITGSITGRAVFSDGTDSGGIIITLEGTDGLRSASALNAGRNLAAGARSIGTGSFAATTQTAVDGSFTLNDIPAGTYILHASSRDSMEQAVAIGVTVTAGEVLDLDTLRLTPVGRISGQIVVDGGDSDAWGFLVSVAGTSFMSVTDIRGMFTISGVPAGDDYHVIVTRGNFTALFTPYAQTVSGGQTTYLDTKYITGTELDISSVITIGPNGNWWINDVDTNIPAQGPQGPQGGQGPEGPTGFVPVEGISLNEDNLSLSIGQSQMLTVTVYPPNATITAILWSSGRPDIASIDMLTGWVTAHAPGVATITATTMQGNQTATSTVTVTATTAGPSSPLASRLLIFQVGASASGAISRSFIELYNTTDDPFDLSTFSLQWANTPGANWNVINLTGTIPARGSYLVVGDVTNPSGRLQIDTADQVVEGFQLNNRQFKVALMANQNRLTVANPFAMPGGGRAAGYVDMVGAVNTGDSIDAFETAVAGYISQQAAVRRVSITDTNNNSADFVRVDYRDANLEQVRPRSSHDGAWEPFPGTVVRQILPSLHLSIAPFERGGPYALHRTEWRPTTVSLHGVGTYQAFEFGEVNAEARGRGNSSWTMSEKRPLRIRFTTARPMFGSDFAARDWTLIANASDHTLMRNYAAYFLGRLLVDDMADEDGGMNFSPTGHLVHLYMDGEYRGVYKLSDQMHAHLGRVELTHHSDPAQSEFLLEWCHRAPNEGGPYFIVQGIPFGITDPRGNNLTSGHQQFARDFIAQVDAALVQGDFGEISQIIDIPSFIDYYLVQELFKNADVGFSSVFLQIRQTRTGTKLFMGPIWDFDLSGGGSGYPGHPLSPQGIHAAQANRYFRLLMATDWFRELVAKRWNEIRNNEVQTMVERIEYLASTYQACFEHNFKRWPNKNLWWTAPALRTLPFTEQVEFLTDWFQQRKIWMDDFLQ